MSKTMRWYGNNLPPVVVSKDIVYNDREIKAGSEVWLFGATSEEKGKIQLKVVEESGDELYLPESFIGHFKSKD